MIWRDLRAYERYMGRFSTDATMATQLSADHSDTYFGVVTLSKTLLVYNHNGLLLFSMSMLMSLRDSGGTAVIQSLPLKYN
jgi:hypothetical protein